LTVSVLPNPDAGGRRWIAVFGDPVAPDLARTLDLGGYTWKSVVNEHELAEMDHSEAWSGAVVDCANDPERAWVFARAIARDQSSPLPVLVLLSGGQLADLSLRDELFDDFCITPFHPAELEARLAHLVWQVGGGTQPETIQYDDLTLNVETYQATIAGRPLDLTYMEYELLKFLAQNPGKVFTREMLLSRVWGYEYYGGARTVDVHIRRLRAKFGEERAGLIHTVRSVGYRFGQSRWGR